MFGFDVFEEFVMRILLSILQTGLKGAKLTPLAPVDDGHRNLFHCPVSAKVSLKYCVACDLRVAKGTDVVTSRQSVLKVIHLLDALSQIVFFLH